MVLSCAKADGAMANRVAVTRGKIRLSRDPVIIFVLFIVNTVVIQ